jgi:hypothetical protein
MFVHEQVIAFTHHPTVSGLIPLASMPGLSANRKPPPEGHKTDYAAPAADYKFQVPRTE